MWIYLFIYPVSCNLLITFHFDFLNLILSLLICSSYCFENDFICDTIEHSEVKTVHSSLDIAMQTWAHT
jgi:hypothetical protein